MSDEEKPIAFASEDLGIRRLAEPSRALRHGIEHRLDFRRRARDHLQDVAGSRLLLQRLLRLVEQPRVLNRDDGLVSKRLQQLDLAIRKWTGFGPIHIDCPNRDAVAQHRNRHGASEEVPDGAKRILSVRIDIRDVLDDPIEDCPTTSAPPVWGGWKFTPQGVDARRRPPTMSRKVKQCSVEPKDGTELRLTELLGASRYRIEHWLDVGRRTGNHAQDFARCRLLLQGLCRLGKQSDIL